MGPLSFANLSPGQFELTPCRVTYKGVDLGATLGNVVVKIEHTLADLKSDQLGSTVIDRKDAGFKATIETALAEVKLKDNWKVVFPMDILAEESGEKSFYFSSKVGQSMRDLAGELILHPLSLPDTDKSGDILVYLATAEAKSELSYSPSDQQQLKLVWNMYPDFATLPPRFMIYGDPDVGLVDASADAATAGTGNIGNGLITDITAFNGFTKDEIITLECIVAGSSGKFEVNGSVSGVLGNATVGLTFNSEPISFLINDGSTDFDEGDTFTIQTHAANYE